MRRAILFIIAMLVAGCVSTVTTTEVTVPPATPTSTTQSTTTASTTVAPTPTTPSTTAAVTTSTAVSAELPPGFEQFGGPDVGFLIALPDTYTAIDLGDDVVAQVIGEFDLDPAARDMVLATLEQGGFAFWAFDAVNSTPTYVPNVNVISRERAALDEVSVYLSLVGSQYEALGGEVVSIEPVEYDFGAAVVAETRLPIGDLEATVVQLLAPVGDWAYSVTFAFQDPTDQDVENARTSFSTFHPLGD
jgi:hypothetical protein